MMKYTTQRLTYFHYIPYRPLQIMLFFNVGSTRPPPTFEQFQKYCKIGTGYGGTSLYQDSKIQNILFDSYSPALCGNPGQFHTR